MGFSKYYDAHNVLTKAQRSWYAAKLARDRALLSDAGCAAEEESILHVEYVKLQHAIKEFHSKTDGLVKENSIRRAQLASTVGEDTE